MGDDLKSEKATKFVGYVIGVVLGIAFRLLVVAGGVTIVVVVLRWMGVLA